MQLFVTVDPQVEVTKVQQTPKPDAQFPSAVPDLLLHSEDEKQVPLTSVEEVEEAPVHWLKNTSLQ